MNFTHGNFEKEVLKAKMPVVVDFGAEWCPPCRLLSPMIEKLAKDYKGKVKIGKLNVDENQAIAEKYQVMSIPTLIFFKEGKVVDKLLGAQPEEVIKKKLNELL